jgi:hypothetical protein
MRILQWFFTICIGCILASQIALGQTIQVSFYGYSKSQVINYYNKLSKKTGYNINVKSAGDTLVVIVDGKQLHQSIFVFSEGSDRVVFQQFDNWCDHCADKNVGQILDLKGFKWKHISDTRYISNIRYRAELDVQREYSQELCTVYKIRYSYVPRKEYLRIYNGY